MLYNTKLKYVLEYIQDAVDMGLLSEESSNYYSQCSWHINEEDVLLFFETLHTLGINVSKRMNGVPVSINYTDGEEDENVRELGFDGGYKISDDDFSSIYIGWYTGPVDEAQELIPVTRLVPKKRTTFTEGRMRSRRHRNFR